VGDHAVTLHLTETQATVTRTTLHRLPRQDLHWSTCPSMDLIINHVLETLVVGGPDEDLSLELPTRVPIVHDFEAALLVSALLEEVGDGFDSDVGEGGGVSLLSSEGANFAQETLNHVANGHARRDGMGVDDDVRSDSLGSKRHVLLPVGNPNGSLLTVARGKSSMPR